MDDLIFSEKKIPDTSDQVGNKAFNLFRGKSAAAVPAFIVLNSNAMLSVLKEEENSAIERKLRKLWINKLSLLEHMEEIRELIMSLKIPSEYMESIKCSLTESNIAAPYAVRSSSVYEDMNENSAPGVFESFLKVSDHELESSIKKCWASNFSDKSLFYFGNHLCSLDDIKMGVIIQTMQYGTYAGIMFTINPVNECEEYVIEMVKEYSNLLTDGANTGTRVLVDPKTKTVKNGISIDEAMVKGLSEDAERLKALFGGHVDIEWSYQEGKTYLIQVRPVSTVNSIAEQDMEYALRSIAEIEDIRCDDTGIGRKFTRWKGKKQHFFRACDSQGVKHLMWYFVKNYDKSHRDEIESILAMFSGEYVTLAVNETLADVVKRKEEVCDFMLEYTQCNPGCIISFREVPYNELSVISNYIPGKGTYLEVIDGILKGLKTGEMRGTVYEFDLDGKLAHCSEYREDMKYTIEFPSGDTSLVPNDKIDLKLYESVFQKIALWTERLHQENQAGAVEWWICNRDIFAADISLNRDVISISNKEGISYVSNGTIEGYAYVIDEETIEYLKDIAFGVGISVDRIDDNVYDNKALKGIREDLIAKKREGHVILCISRPHLGIAPLLDYASGVIFGEASMLCHLSVMLREKKIPAISIGSRINSIKTGNYIEFVNK